MTHVPPSRYSSASMTLAPCPDATRAARMPPEPPPMTNKSTSNSASREAADALAAEYVIRFIAAHPHRFATAAVPRIAPASISRVVTAALLSEVAEVVTLPDLRSKVAEDRVRNRDVEEEVGQHQVPDVIFAAEPPTHDRRRQLVCVGLRAGNLVRLHVLQKTASLKEPALQRRIHHRCITGCWRIVLHQLRHVRLDLVAAYGELSSEREHVGREPLAKNPPRLKRPGPFECLGVVEIVVHYVQSMHHDRDCDVIDREGHADLHALVCSLNVGRAQ